MPTVASFCLYDAEKKGTIKFFGYLIGTGESAPDVRMFFREGPKEVKGEKIKDQNRSLAADDLYEDDSITFEDITAVEFQNLIDKASQLQCACIKCKYALACMRRPEEDVRFEEGVPAIIEGLYEEQS